MDFNEFQARMTLLEVRAKRNLEEYQSIQKSVSSLEERFCSCGFIMEWLERGDKRESLESLFNFLNEKKNGHK